MKRIKFVLAALAGWLAIPGLQPSFAVPVGGSAADRPNIVFILGDDLGINDLACYGRTEHHTPHLDKLAASGVRFTSAYVAAPVCSPSRAAILTGKHPGRLHLTTFLPGRRDCPAQMLLHPKIEQQLPLAEKTLPEYLKAAGYKSGCFGKWHLGGEGYGPLEQGFDLYHKGNANTTPSETEGGKGEYDLTSAAEKFIETNREAPFFLYLAHNSPHIPYSAKTNLIAGNRDAFEPTYAAVIETLDDAVGRLLRRIDALGLSTNTIIIFTSDNGGLHVPELKHERITHNAPFRAGKAFPYEGGIRIPLIARWPGHISPGRVEPRPVINTDWLPTLLEAASLAIPKGLDGASILPLLVRGEPGRSRSFFWHFPHYSNQGNRPFGAIRSGNWKLVEYFEDNSVELYNLGTDPSEANNIAVTEPGRARHLQAELAAWRLKTGVQTNTANPRFDPAQYRPIYRDVDVSRYNASKANPALTQQVLEWRQVMDAAVGKKK